MACSSDDDVTIPEVPETGLETRQLPKQADFIKTVTEIGYIKCDTWDNTWIIDVPSPEAHGEIYIDGGSFYYLYDLPQEYQKKGQKVKATLDAYTFRHFGEKIEVVYRLENDGNLPPFTVIELAAKDGTIEADALEIRILP